MKYFLGRYAGGGAGAAAAGHAAHTRHGCRGSGQSGQPARRQHRGALRSAHTFCSNLDLFENSICPGFFVNCQCLIMRYTECQCGIIYEALLGKFPTEQPGRMSSRKVYTFCLLLLADSIIPPDPAPVLALVLAFPSNTGVGYSVWSCIASPPSLNPGRPAGSRGRRPHASVYGHLLLQMTMASVPVPTSFEGVWPVS